MSGDNIEPLTGIPQERLDWHWGALAHDPVVCAAEQPGQPGYPCIHNTLHHPHHEDVLGRTWPLHERRLFVAPPRLIAGDDRTITLDTTDHGPVVLTCPAWCIGHDSSPGARIDISHESVETVLTLPTPEGDVDHLTVLFEQRPFVAMSPGTGMFANVEINGMFHPAGPADLDAIADGLVANAAELRATARRLADMVAEEQPR
ncbi:hypothetical protein CG740_37150 [Streptomyces sp. CB01201]|uniref:DUF6907 domain-containing protein n=1 Tax=Streptomyces sp. CB01201 TaxID=2020324 RepID=UPI000C2725B5|nr:hypothetical protein [Streptomyces sp. CB01201]PJM98114.1 hypothetical protein CG740_37150 [Streptomyces sp. CB01201]